MRPLRLIFLCSLLMTSLAAHADWSANAGWASEYYYRGIFQKTSSPSAGVDFTTGGFYAGTWVADVGDGLEIDGYFGYGGEAGAVTYGVGFTGYYYTGDFDDTYKEINLSAGYGIVTFDVAVGQYENFDSPTTDYTFYSMTIEKNGFYGRYGAFDQDFSGSYFEVGYATTIAELDFGLNAIFSDSDLAGGASDEALVFTIGKPFDLN